MDDPTAGSGEGLLRGILDRLAVRQHPVTVDDQQVAATIATIRRSYGLFTRAQTEAWLEDQGMTEEDFIDDARRIAKLHAVQQAVAGADAVAARFAARSTDFDSVVLDVRTCATAPEAEALAAQVRARGGWSTVEIGASWPALRPYRRLELPAALHGPAFDQALDQVVGPIAAGSGFLLVRPVSRKPAVLDSDTATFIAALLFEEWLAERRLQLSPSWIWDTVAADAG